MAEKRFRQIVKGEAVIYVMAEDMHEADDLISNMSTEDILAEAEIEFYTYDTDEFPEEV